MFIRASIVARRMLQARGLSSLQITDAMAGYSLGCIITHAKTVAVQYR